MTAESVLLGALAPARDHYVAEMLEALSDAIDSGADVDIEPLELDAEGDVLRRDPLRLPRRRDMELHGPKGMVLRRVTSQDRLDFAPLRLDISAGAPVDMGPFAWDSCDILCRAAPGRPDWSPVRLWLLEWILPRFVAESPDLLGAAHEVLGPVETPEGWRFKVDLGSAPVEAAAHMAEAFAATGCAALRVGGR